MMPSILPRPSSTKIINKKEYEDWWSKNSHLSLKEMQIDALEYRIKMEKSVGFKTKTDEEECLSPLYRELELLKNKK